MTNHGVTALGGGVWVAAALALLASAPVRTAQASSDHGATVLVFPKVVADGVRDTTIQITNISNLLTHAHCYYVNAAPTNPALPPGPTNPPLWVATDFVILLTRQQPTVWIASKGRPNKDGDSFHGLDPGPVPAVSSGFEGELVCYQIDDSGIELEANSLTGVATLQDLASGDISAYNAVGLIGLVNNSNFDNQLSFDGSEFEACPDQWQVIQMADAAQDPLAGAGSSMRTELTMVPCTQNFDTQAPVTFHANIAVTNELEQQTSTSQDFDCWANVALSDLGATFTAANLGSDFIRTSLSSSPSFPGFLLVAEEFHSSPGPQVVRGAAGADAQSRAVRSVPDTMTVTTP